MQHPSGRIELDDTAIDNVQRSFVAMGATQAMMNFCSAAKMGQQSIQECDAIIGECTRLARMMAAHDEHPAVLELQHGSGQMEDIRFQFQELVVESAPFQHAIGNDFRAAHGLAVDGLSQGALCPQIMVQKFTMVALKEPVGHSVKSEHLGGAAYRVTREQGGTTTVKNPRQGTANLGPRDTSECGIVKLADEFAFRS